MKKDFICIKDLASGDITDIFTLTDGLKQDKNKYSRVLAGKALALIFQKPSNRTRVSFEVGMYQLGGYSIYLGPDEINLGVRESIKDVARTLSRYVDGIVLRTFEHKNILELAKFSALPVINGLSDLLHPCQALADIYTVREKLKNIKGVTLAYVGDGNNVCNSLLYACASVGMNMHVATPKGYEPDKAVLREAQIIAKENGSTINLFIKPQEAARGADVIYTDVWTSMGQEKEAQIRKKVFKEYQVNKRLMQSAKKGVLIMHCLPAHRGDEITDEAIDSENSVVFDQAENRMHIQKAILIKLLK
ncbi:MAG: ornithine carbamoyltransferase [Candidatus Omnitrophica bacterium]|nr:ornithine carbamoyltransferase [Candidatus Omnitrophota bacterium]MDD5592843.1 ornithine carbamoyltransferase [Candidatus Omnitrophota bacterium]